MDHVTVMSLSVPMQKMLGRVLIFHAHGDAKVLTHASKGFVMPWFGIGFHYRDIDETSHDLKLTHTEPRAEVGDLESTNSSANGAKWQ